MQNLTLDLSACARERELGCAGGYSDARGEMSLYPLKGMYSILPSSVHRLHLHGLTYTDWGCVFQPHDMGHDVVRDSDEGVFQMHQDWYTEGADWAAQARHSWRSLETAGSSPAHRNGASLGLGGGLESELQSLEVSFVAWPWRRFERCKENEVSFFLGEASASWMPAGFGECRVRAYHGLSQKGRLPAFAVCWRKGPHQWHTDATCAMLIPS